LRLRPFILGGALLFASVASSFGAVELAKISWQIQKKDRLAEHSQPMEIEVLPLVAGNGLPGRLSVRLKVLNRGPKEAAGILLRYAVSAQIAPLSEKSKDSGTWALPFLLEERRIPKIGPNIFSEIEIDLGARTDAYLKHITQEGFWAQSVKMEVMIEPKRETVATSIRIIASSLPFLASVAR
jgi:hypothetical protein